MTGYERAVEAIGRQLLAAERAARNRRVEKRA